MKIVTIEEFGRAKSDSGERSGNIYEGEAYLLRFIITSPEHFFRTELERLCWKVFSIDPRQIMELTIYGGGFGLYDVRLLISFEETPDPDAFHQLQLVAPETPDEKWPDDDLDSLLKQLLQSAKPALKKNIARWLQQEVPSET